MLRFPLWSVAQSFVLEAILTAILMFVILGVSTGAAEKGITAGIAVGAVIGLEAMFAGPICGASMNPARSLAPALISGFATRLDISRRSGNRCLRWGVRLPLCTRVGMLFESARRYEPTCQKGIKFLIDLRAALRATRAIFPQSPVAVTN